LILVLQLGRDFVQVPELDLILNLVLVPKIKPDSGWVLLTELESMILAGQTK
jgi:hypothetical protein